MAIHIITAFFSTIISRGRNGGYVVHIAYYFGFWSCRYKFYDERLDLNLHKWWIKLSIPISFNQIEQEFIAENSITKAKFTILIIKHKKNSNITIYSYYQIIIK